MKIVIVGAGSIGLLLGSYLSEMGHDLYFLTRREEQAKTLRTKGITRVMPNKQEIVVRVDATTHVQHLPKDALWICAVKYHHLEDTKRILQHTSSDTPLLFIQNGLGHLKWMGQLENKRLYIGTIEHGAMKQNDWTVLHKGIGSLNLAPLYPTEENHEEIFSSTYENFPVVWGNDAHFLVLRKTILNACINPLTALLQIKNGDLVKNTNAANLLQKVYEEIMSVFPEMKPHITLKVVQQLCEKTGENYSSMLQDMQQGKKTEIETIAGSLLQVANERQKEIPTLATIYKLICAIEESGVKRE
ncbi:MAG: ketopantoate reductase family protein [Paenisporosarcina sp.]